MERDKLLGTMDAKVWTDEFMATRARLGDKEFDHAMMLARFANAIMAGFDEANRPAQRALDALQAQVQAKDAEIAALKEHQKLHDRIFERQKLLLSHYAGTIKEAAKRLRYSTHSIEQPEPYNSRTPIVAAFLEQALGVNAEELEKERDTLTHANARLREALRKIAAYADQSPYPGCCQFGCDTPTIAQHALADTEGQEGT